MNDDKTAEIKLNIDTKTVAAMLGGDWDAVGAEELRDILAEIESLGNDYSDYDGLSDRIANGPTYWTMYSEDACDREINEPCDRDDAISECESWLQDGDWEPQSVVTGEVKPQGLDYYSDENGVQVTIDAEEAPECPEASEHDWTSEFEGGCDSNPGCWSVGGTKMKFTAHCRHCGMSRTEICVGSQRNPGEHDTTTYGEPDAEWVAQNIGDGIGE